MCRRPLARCSAAAASTCWLSPRTSASNRPCLPRRPLPGSHRRSSPLGPRDRPDWPHRHRPGSPRPHLELRPRPSAGCQRYSRSHPAQDFRPCWGCRRHSGCRRRSGSRSRWHCSCHRWQPQSHQDPLGSRVFPSRRPHTKKPSTRHRRLAALLSVISWMDSQAMPRVMRRRTKSIAETRFCSAGVASLRSMCLKTARSASFTSDHQQLQTRGGGRAAKPAQARSPRRPRRRVAACVARAPSRCPGMPAQPAAPRMHDGCSA